MLWRTKEFTTWWVARWLSWRFWILSTAAAMPAMLAGEVQTGRTFGKRDREDFREAHRLGIIHGIIFLVEPHEAPVRPPLLPFFVWYGDETRHHVCTEVEGEAT
jgi:Na+-driven multidrug efflux pump